ncbi:MAG: hypothetical protein GY804_06550 [Alphaproteobacteria bacterium]|nr:hypothetical protein [Alphaproteobacteria bacterium]
MSIIITNITNEHVPVGENQYVVRINQRVICEFSHRRTYNGLAQCLRDAADAVEAQGARSDDQIDIEELLAAMDALESEHTTSG